MFEKVGARVCLDGEYYKQRVIGALFLQGAVRVEVKIDDSGIIFRCSLDALQMVEERIERHDRFLTMYEQSLLDDAERTPPTKEQVSASVSETLTVLGRGTLTRSQALDAFADEMLTPWTNGMVNATLKTNHPLTGGTEELAYVYENFGNVSGWHGA